MSPAPRTPGSAVVLLLVLLVSLVFLTGCGATASGAGSSRPTATAPEPTSTATPSPSPSPSMPAALPCSMRPGALAPIRAGGEGALLDTFDGRWGPQGVVADGNMAFGRYVDTGRQKVLVPSHLPASTRVWTVQYFVDTTQQVSLADAAAIAASILPQDAVPQSPAVRSGNDIMIGYCSAAILRAFPYPTYVNGSGTYTNPALMAYTGLLTVGYFLRADGTVDSVVVGDGCVTAEVCALA